MHNLPHVAPGLRKRRADALDGTESFSLVDACSLSGPRPHYRSGMSDPLGAPVVTHHVYCPTCQVHRNCKVAGAADDFNPENGPPSRVSLVQCQTCTGQVVLVQEDYGNGWDSPYRVWPAQHRPLSVSVPAALRAEHEEARKCLDAQAYTAAVVMVRRTLEGVCQEKGVRERVLAKSLQKMEEQGFLDPRLRQWAEELRGLGNEGAHFTGKSVLRQDAIDAVAFSEALLDYMYVLTAKFDEFRKRRERSTERLDKS